MPITEAIYRTHSPIPPFLPGDQATLTSVCEHLPVGTHVKVTDIHDLSPNGWMFQIAHEDDRLIVHVDCLEPRS